VKRLLLALMMVLALVLPGSTVYAAPQNLDSNAKVKNVIVMISDGCGYNQILATDYYQYGKAGTQVYEHFPTALAMSTYSADGWGYDSAMAWSDFGYVTLEPTDSAAAATAMSTGFKTYDAAIGVDLNGAPLEHISQYAEELGKSTGVITSVPLSHATPAGFVAHNVSRNNFAAIANEMIYQSAVDVVMGTGAPDYDNSGNPVNPAGREQYVGGAATWADLGDGSVIGADADGDGDSDTWALVRDRSAFQALASGQTPARVIGIPRVYTTLQQARSGNGNADPYVVPLTPSVPTLEEMTRAALNVLDNDPDGFFLMVEGGAIDWAGHGRQSGRMIEEEIDFNRSVEAVLAWVQANSNWGETLVIVTGDHETGYLLGPGSDPDWKPIVNNGAGNLPGMGWFSNVPPVSANHTNSLVPFFAKGDVARLFKAYADERDIVRGPYIDNIEIAHAIFGSLK